MKDYALRFATKALLALAWLAERLEDFARWVAIEASGEAAALSRLHSAAWRKRREDERFERINGSWP